MENFERTMNVCEGYLSSNPFVTSAFRKEEGSSSQGFLYYYEKDEFSVMVDLRVDESIRHILMDVHASIEPVKDESRVTKQLLYEYCQQHSGVDEPGFLCVSDRHNYVQYHISTPFIDGPISVETLDWMNDTAWEKLHMHTPNLQLLASGHLPEMQPDINIEKLDSNLFPLDNYRKTVDSLPEQLLNSRHNVIGRNIREDKRKLYMDQVFTGEFALYRELRVNDTGCLIIAIRTEYRVPKSFQRGKLMVHANNVNSTHKVCGLRVLNKDGYIWISAAISLWDGPISGEAIEHVSSVLMSVVARYYDDFVNYAHGRSNKKYRAAPDVDSIPGLDEMLKAVRPDEPTVRNPFRPIPQLDDEDSKKIFEDLFGHGPDGSDDREQEDT